MTQPMDARAREYIEEAGWALCAIEPASKKPRGKKWESRPRKAEHWQDNPKDGIGLIHAHSGTCTIDLDWMEAAEIALSAVGVDIRALLAAPDAVQIIGAPGRGKLLFRVPEGHELTRRSLNWPNPETGKNQAVVELRAAGVQDVLPPSIHPDTQEPYRWQGDWQNIPELPAELLDVWTNWEAARQDMEVACPWNDQPGAASQRYDNVPRRTYAEGESVIAAFNEAHSIRPILEAFGYLKAGPRYISPHSTTGTPGVVFLPGSQGRLIYVHHGSDPLGDGHSHDAFSVWCHLEHGGDVSRAVRTAAEMLGIAHAQRENQEGAEIAARIMGRVDVPPPPERPDPRRTDEPEPPPDEPIPVPELAQLEHWLRRRHFGSKPVATTQGALAFAAAMTARRYVTSDRQPTSVMLGIVDSSTAGLRPLKGALYEAADSAGERKVIRGTKIASEAAVHRALLRSPRMFFVADDYGYMVAMSRRQPSGALESALAVLHETYGGYALYLDPEITGKKDAPLAECTVQAPAIAMLALVSEDQMREVTRRAEYGRGSVQQILFARGDQATADDAGAAPSAPVPKAIVERVGDLRRVEQNSLGGLYAMATHPPSPATVDLGPGVAETYAEIQANLRMLFQDGDLARWRGIAHGAMVTVRRLSAALGAWADPERPVVTADIARWVGRWAVYHVSRSVEWYEAISSDDGDPDLISDIRSVMYAAGPAGITGRELARRCRAFRRLSASQRSETLEQMVEDRLCAGIANARTTKYVDRAYLQTVPDPSTADK